MSKILKRLRNTPYFLLFLVILLATAYRFYNLSSLPVSPYWDEVSIGYNAYSIGVNGKDEYGVTMPLLFKAYSDYKLPVYIYLSVIPIKILGLSEFSVRFAYAFFGVLTVGLTFLLVRELLLQLDSGGWTDKKSKIPLFASLFLAISPWHIQFSRAAFEANVGLFFVVLGTYLFFKSFRKGSLLPFSVFSYAIGCYTYRSVFLFAAIFFTSLCIIWWKKMLLNKSYLLLAIIIGIITIAPLLLALSGKGATRFQQTSIEVEANRQALESFTQGKPLDRKILLAKIFVQGYVSEMSPDFLFFSGDSNGRHNVKGMGVLYLWDLPFLIVGVIILIKKIPRRIGLSLLVWFLAFPIPAALSIPAPHALRTLNALPLPQIVTAIGMVASIFYFRKYKKIYVSILALIVFFFTYRYGHSYIVSHSKTYAADWGDGYKQLALYIQKNYNEYDSFIISGHYWQPYAYMLFYTQYDPKKYQTTGNFTHFDKYYFGGTAWDLDVGRPELNTIDLRSISKGNVLIALSPEEYKYQQQNLIKKDTIYDHNGKLVFIISNHK